MLNVTETDFRHYDSALGRFNLLDPMAELAPDFIPYRYGFNNPVFWSDASGLFESYLDARYYQLSHGLFGGSSIEYDADSNSWSINTGKSMITQIGEWIQTTYELDGGGMGADYTRAGGGGSSNDSQSKKNDGGFWKTMETGGMFQVWGVMRDMPGFKPNSRKRSAVDASMNYDEAYERGKTSLMKGAEFWKRLKEGVSGADSRGSTLWDRLNATETNDMIKMQYNSWNVYENGSWIYEHPYIIKITKDTMIHNNQLGKSNLKNLEIRDSIIKYKLYEKSIQNFKNK